ncbi:MAG: rhodanese-like domain-containing protein [Burkholderiaceae bacterium]|jgi:thiosulfate/3-mercaptopyruvate sulfurtransferase|nr:sulfurtransferase [Burkholderiales bacterium]MCZ8105202.1 rhodanese-like domain-containing protein [Burkholderiales bacterium]MCZ8338869.1 rhodanese-like domain-containing protein [Burkholderiaceae bacterium]
MHRTLRRVAIGLALAAHAAFAFAQSLIVDTAGLEQALARGAVVWDARGPADYAAGHVPGAVNFGAAGDLFRDANREDPPSAAVAAQLFGTAGIDIANREVVVYGGKGDPIAYFAARMLEYYGGRHGRVYHGGIDDWRAAGRPLSTQATKLPPLALELKAERVGTLWTHEVIDRVKAGGAQILDTRTEREFSGEDIRAIRGGHIAGAVNIPYEANWVDPDTPSKLASRRVQNKDGMSLKPADQLRSLYARLDPSKETVVYCQSGVRASETAVVLRELGFTDVKVYEPSWLGYAGVLSAPAGNEVFVNVGALNGQIASMQARLRQLEAALQALQPKPAQ